MILSLASSQLVEWPDSLWSHRGCPKARRLAQCTQLNSCSLALSGRKWCWLPRCIWGTPEAAFVRSTSYSASQFLCPEVSTSFFRSNATRSALRLKRTLLKVGHQAFRSPHKSDTDKSVLLWLRLFSLFFAESKTFWFLSSLVSQEFLMMIKTNGRGQW